MSWIQQNKVPAAIIGVSVAGAAGLGFMMFNAWQGHSTALEQFDNLNRGIAGLNSATLAPTEENLAAKKALVEEFATEANKLQTVLQRLQAEVVPETLSDTGFQSKLKTRIAEVRKLATGRMGLPAEFNLAFDKYNSELPKSNEQATELSGYLDAVERIVDAMVSSGVRQLDMIERSDLESEKVASATPARKGQAQTTQAVKSVDVKTLRAVITTDQAALQVLLSKLASPSEMPFFSVVRLVRIENERKEGPLRAEIGLHTLAPAGGGETDDLVPPTPINITPPVGTAGGSPAVDNDTIAAVQPLGQDAVDVLGNEMLKAYLEIDILGFLSLISTTQTGGK